MSSLPPREALTQPLLEALDRYGPLSPSAAAAAVAHDLQLPKELREETVTLRDSRTLRVENALQYRLRWVRQLLTQDELLDGSIRGVWSLSKKGERFMVRASPGIVVRVFETNLGTALAAEANSVLQLVTDGVIQTCITSPVYPIAHPREYGAMTGPEVVAFVDQMLRQMAPKLTHDANVFVNVGPVFTPRNDTQSTYIERLVIALEDQGYHLIQRYYWHNPTKPPAGASVTGRRVHLVEKVEPIFRFSKNCHPRGDNRAILQPYSPRMTTDLGKGGDRYGRRPSGHGHGGKSFARDNGGAIPGNLFTVPHESWQSAAASALRARGFDLHPAAMPEKLVEPLIKFTTRPGEVVADFMGGSATVQRVAERLGRRWLYSDVHLNYAAESSVHFEHCPGFRRHVDPVALRDAFR